MKQSAEPKVESKIGLIGGLAHRAGIFYYEQLIKYYRASDRVLLLTLTHADVNTVLACVSANDRAGLGTYLGMLANELFAGGADLVAITAVAPHLAIREVSEIAQGPLVNVLDAVASGLKAAKLDRVAIFGNRSAVETNIFGAIPQRAVVKLKPSQVEEIHRTYTEIALAGKHGTQPETEQLNEIARELVEKSRVQAIVLAGTDLSSFYSDQPPDYPYLDIAQLHIAEIVKQAGSCGS